MPVPDGGLQAGTAQVDGDGAPPAAVTLQEVPL
jgi:hypothetical protein